MYFDVLFLFIYIYSFGYNFSRLSCLSFGFSFPFPFTIFLVGVGSGTEVMSFLLWGTCCVSCEHYLSQIETTLAQRCFEINTKNIERERANEGGLIFTVDIVHKYISSLTLFPGGTL